MSSFWAYIAVTAMGFVTSAWAGSTCPTQDLAEAPESPIWSIPVYDQDGSGTCYAHAAAFLIDFARARKGESIAGDLTDPIYLAWVDQYQSAFIGQRSLDGGYVSNAANSPLSEGGVCRQADVKAAFDKLSSGTNLSHAQVVHLLDVLDDSNWKANFSKEQTWGLRSQGISCAQSQSVLGSVASAAAEAVGKGCSGVLNQVFKDCQKRKRELDLPKMDGISVGSDEDMQNEMDRMLNSGQPAGVSLCADVLYTSSSRGLRGGTSIFPRAMNWNIDSSKCGGLHAVAAIGRREIGGRCSYLIRNSWGATRRTTAALTCACKIKDASGKLLILPTAPRGHAM